MAMEAPEVLIRDLLDDEWRPNNTFDLKPSIHFGWFDDNGDTPQVTVPQGEESPVGGGQTGYDSIDQDGNPGQTIAGTVSVSTWCRRGMLSGATIGNPRQYNFALTEEIKRIVKKNADSPTNPETGNEPVDNIAYFGRRAQPDTDRRKTVFRYIVTIGYGYPEL